MELPTKKENKTKSINGIKFTYEEWYHYDFYVDEATGLIDYQRLAKKFTIAQFGHNLKASKKAYLIAKNYNSHN